MKVTKIFLIQAVAKFEFCKSILLRMKFIMKPTLTSTFEKELSKIRS